MGIKLNERRRHPLRQMLTWRRLTLTTCRLLPLQAPLLLLPLLPQHIWKHQGDGKLRERGATERKATLVLFERREKQRKRRKRKKERRRKGRKTAKMIVIAEARRKRESEGEISHLPFPLRERRQHTRSTDRKERNEERHH